MNLARLFVIFGALIVLALTVALVGPYFVDWTNYRGDFEREASRILGRQVTVNGTARARLLPFPSVSFSDVSVAGEVDGEPAMTVETFSMDAELAPFMRGEILIFDMRVERPRAVVRLDDSGRFNWALRAETPAGVAHVTLESIKISDGEIVIQHTASGTEHTLTAINAEVSARTLAGPWRLNGEMTFDGEPAKISVSTGTAGTDGRLRLRARLLPDEIPVTIEADGNAWLADTQPHYGGTFTLASRTQEEAGEDGPFRISVVDEPAVLQGGAGFRVTGEFELDHRLLAFDTFRFESGGGDDPYTAEGNGFVDLGAEPRFAIRAEGRQFRFDEEVAGGGEGGALDLGERVIALREALARVPKPAMAGTVDVTLPAVVAGDTTIRDVVLSAEPEQTGWLIKHFSAALPGRTTLEADGHLATGDAFGFSGNLLLAVNQPSGFAAWLSADVDEAIRRLGNAGFSGKVELTEQRQTLRDMELVLGGARFSGLVDRLQPGDARPSVTMELDGGALDIDGLTAFAALFVSEKGRFRHGEHDFDLKLKAGPVALGGIGAESVDTAIRLKDGRLDVDRMAIAGLGGAAVSATATLEDLAGAPHGNIDASILSDDMGRLARLVAERFPEHPVARALERRLANYPELFHEAEVDFVASVATEKPGEIGLAVSARGRSGGTDFTATLSARGAPDDLPAAPFDFYVTASNEDAAPILAAYGLPALPLGLGGRTETGLLLKGSLDAGFDVAATVSGPGAVASVTGRGQPEDNGFALYGKASVEGGDLHPWLMATGYPVGGIDLGVPVSLASPVRWKAGVLSMPKLEGSVLDSAVAGALDADFNGERPRVTGALSLSRLDVMPVFAMLLGEEALAGYAGGDGDVPFNPNAALPVDADLEIQAAALDAGDLLHAANARLRMAADNRRVRLSGISAELHGGRFDGLIEIANNDGSALVSGQVNMADVDLAAIMPGAGLTGVLGLSASLSTSGKSAGAAVAALSGSGTAAARGLRIEGLNGDALAALIEAADRFGTEVDAGKVAEVAPPLVTSGATDAGDVDFAFVVAGGVVRSAPVRIVTERATVAAEMRADLKQGLVHADGSIAYDAGVEALVGSSPAVGFSYSGRPGEVGLTLDTAPLAQFLAQRALEIEQARVEAMQSALLEKQRLRREVQYFAALEDVRALKAKEQEAARKRAEEEARAKAEEEARARAATEEVLRRAEEAIFGPPDPAAPQDGGAEIERAPLPPPSNGSGQDGAQNKGSSGASISDIFKPGNLTIENILKSGSGQ